MLALSKGLNWIDVFPPHLRTETDQTSETSCFLFSRIWDDGKVQNPSNSEENFYAVLDLTFSREEGGREGEHSDYDLLECDAV
jgi:hypothetical protein